MDQVPAGPPLPPKSLSPRVSSILLVYQRQLEEKGSVPLQARSPSFPGVDTPREWPGEDFWFSSDQLGKPEVPQPNGVLLAERSGYLRFLESPQSKSASFPHFFSSAQMPSAPLRGGREKAGSWGREVKGGGEKDTGEGREIPVRAASINPGR